MVVHRRWRWISLGGERRIWHPLLGQGEPVRPGISWASQLSRWWSLADSQLATGVLGRRSTSLLGRVDSPLTCVSEIRNAEREESPLLEQRKTRGVRTLCRSVVTVW
jgi:hypothetical protein